MLPNVYQCIWQLIIIGVNYAVTSGCERIFNVPQFENTPSAIGSNGKSWSIVRNLLIHSNIIKFLANKSYVIMVNNSQFARNITMCEITNLNIGLLVLS